MDTAESGRRRQSTQVALSRRHDLIISKLGRRHTNGVLESKGPGLCSPPPPGKFQY